MKHIVKKLASAATALLFAIQTYGAVFAENADGVFSSDATGQLNVIISPALYVMRNVDFTAELTGRGAQTVTLKKDGGGAEARFSDLSAGEYTLKVSADGFADYTQKINMESQALTLRLMTDFVKGVDSDNGAHAGTLLIGDVNGDGVIDEKDRESLTDAVDSGESGGLTDLNGDGSIDLADMEYLAKGYKTANALASFETAIPSSVIAPSVGENTEAEGELENLFSENGKVRLTVAGGRISDETPAVLQFDIAEQGEASIADGIIIGVSEDNPVARAEVNIVYTDADGQERTGTIPFENGVHHLTDSGEAVAVQDESGNIRVNLGSRIAVKRVTFIIYGMTENSSLADISFVEFVNGMENKIPEPASDIPENLEARAADKSFVLTWDGCVNVTGYEVMITRGETSETKRVTGCSMSVSSFNGKKLENGTPYTVKVQSVNGAWKSGYCGEITVTPKASSRPDRPDGLTALGAYRSVLLSWKAAEDAEWYNIYYKLRTEEEYHKIAGVNGTSYTVSDLEDKAEYVAYVTAENEHGESGPSLTASASTTDINPPAMPKYNLINVGENGEIGQHIISASQNYGTMVGSSVEENERTAWGTVDHNPNSHYLRETWDDGGYNNLNRHGLFYEFDEEYTIQTFALHESVPISPALFYTKINYWDAQGNLTSLGYNQVSTVRKTDGEGRVYYLIRLPQKAQIKKIQIGLARYVASGKIDVSEIYFYYYDTVADDIANLYEDDLHLVLRPEVTQAVIDGLRNRLNTPDEVSGELNPDRELLERELKNAEDILNCKDLGQPVHIHNTISTYDVNRGFGGLNAWQPIGVTAAAGDTVTVYVGHNTKATGSATNLQLVATQYHSESGSAAKTVASLKTGVNVVDIPKLWSIDEESGGALYIQYTGNNKNDRYAVRVSGGVKVPVLDLYGVEDESEKLRLAEIFVNELLEYTERMEELHAQHHAASSNANVKYEYDARNCILGASDIMLDNMLLSLPAIRILAGTGEGGAAEKAARLADSLNAMENMLHLFYQHKGLNDSAENEIDRLPKQHLNIRYQRMFSKAFMYAAGNHIGIEWNECAGMTGAPLLVSDEEGRYVSGRYFGWGIAHEIGHCINQNAYEVAEITNNYFAQLAQAKDSNSGMRFTYENIYEKVTSGTFGQSSNLATQLGMYWQLHLAYDTGYNYKTYEEHGEQLENLFYARVDSYARTPASAPAPGGIPLVLGGGTDQNLMRLACAAAEKNLLEFFLRWGKIPDSATIEYASQFEKEERAIYYADDDSRVYRIENPYGGYLGTSGTAGAVSSDTKAALSSENSYQVNFKLVSENIPDEEVLGYEIVRCTVSGGKVSREAVGFTVENTFTDYAAGLNNRVVTYEVMVVDKYLYRSAPMILEPIKIRDDGSLDKSWWTLSAGGIAADSVIKAEEGSDDMPCAPTETDPVVLAADGDSSTEYVGTLSDLSEITIRLNKRETISGFRYTPGSGASALNYTVAVRADDGSWLNAASGVSDSGGAVYFENADGKYVSTYKTDAVKLVFSGQAGRKISVAELDVLGVTGDNVELVSTSDGAAAIGILSEDYKYGSGENDVIPKGSTVFTGSYKGNPAYNVVMLFDQNGSIVGGINADGSLTADQIILAEDPGSGLLQDVWNGIWIYWIKPGTASLEGVTKVRAELYRVNNALTNEGERLVSDSMFVNIPEELPPISFESNAE